MPLALFLVDALSTAYVSGQTLPAIRNVARGGFAGSLANIYAYRGIEATLFTGLAPSEHGVWGEFRPAPAAPAREPMLDRLARLAIRIGDVLPSDRLRLDARYVIARLRQPNRHLPTSNLIPAHLIPWFTRSLETPIWQPGSLGAITTIFDELRAAGRSFEIVGYPIVQRDDRIVSRVTARVHQGTLPDFWYIKFSALDALGHRFGPDVTRLAPALRALNEQLTHLVSALKSAYSGGIDIAVVSDHGMSRVEHTIDVRPLLKQMDLVPGRGLLYFLDSTTIRFWSENPRTRDVIAARFAEMPGARLLGARARSAVHVPDGVVAGDLLIALDEGNVVFPDFFRRHAAPVGMHGYARVDSLAGLPFLAAEPALAEHLPANRQLTHVDMWRAIRGRLGLIEEELCTSSS